jgi:hypothetical protein
MKSFILLLAILISGSPAHSQAEDSRSVGWQKVMLEQTLQERIKTALSAYTKGEDFVARVDVIATRLHAKERGQVGAGSFSLGKLDMIAPGLPSHIDTAEDVFSYIEKVVVSVTLPKSVVDQHKAEIEKVLRATVTPVTQTPVSVAIDTFPDPTADEIAKAEAAKVKTWQQLLEANAVPASIFAAVLLMAFLFLRLLSVYRSIESKKLEAVTQASSPAQASPQARQQDQDAVRFTKPKSSGQSSGQIIDPNLSAQIQSIVVAYPQKIPALVRRWLTSNEDKSNEALWILPKLLPMNAMVQLAAQLDDPAKRAWRSLLEEPSPEWSEASAQEYVAFELIDDVLRQSFPLADDLRMLLDGVKTDEVAELAAKDVKQGALLINILSTAQAARVLTLLPTDVRTQVVAHCPAIDLDDVVKMTPLIRQELQKLRRKSDTVTVPFTERALELVREVGPELEGDIFDALARNLPQAELQKTLRNVCPAEVILEAGPALHRQCLTSIPLAQRADLIFSSSSKRQAMLLLAFPDGEKVRELLDSELSMLDHDQVRAAKARRESEKLWRTYLQACRRLIQTDEAAAETVKPAVSRWIAARAHEEKRNAA